MLFITEFAKLLVTAKVKLMNSASDKGTSRQWKHLRRNHGGFINEIFFPNSVDIEKCHWRVQTNRYDFRGRGILWPRACSNHRDLNLSSRVQNSSSLWGALTENRSPAEKEGSVRHSWPLSTGLLNVERIRDLLGLALRVAVFKSKAMRGVLKHSLFEEPFGRQKAAINKNRGYWN